MTGRSEAARAKVNLTLRVIGRRADGYHDLESIVAFADCADDLTFTEGPDLSLDVTGPGAASCGNLDDNLVLTAARLLATEVEGLKHGVFSLDKRLPVAAGIGGGSADAAAALRLLARANSVAIDDPRLVSVALQTGADVPACLQSRACLMGGIGETISPIDLPPLPCVLVNPRVAVATRDVFTALGLRNGELRVGAADILDAQAMPESASTADWIDFISAGGNDLETPAVAIAPVVGEVLTMLGVAEGARLARMSGSGATCFAIFDDDASARRAAQAIATAQPGWWVHAGTLS